MNLTRQQLFSDIRQYIALFFGLICYAVGWTAFMLPYGVTLGGVTGIAALLDFATEGSSFHIPIQLTYFVLNSILLIFALRILGWKFCTKTIFGVVMLTLLLQIGKDIMGGLENPFLLGEGENFMSCVLGACHCGLGLGICFVNGGSTGGTDIIAAIINKYRDISFGTMVMLSDLVIIACNYLVFHDIRRVLFGYVALFIMSVVLDYYINTTRQSVQLFIISHNKHEEIAEFITQQGHRGVTVLNAMGWYSKNEHDVLFVLARKRESSYLLSGIKQIDPEAFVSMAYVKGVYGNGFDRIKAKAKEKKSEKA